MKLLSIALALTSVVFAADNAPLDVHVSHFDQAACERLLTTSGLPLSPSSCTPYVHVIGYSLTLPAGSRYIVTAKYRDPGTEYEWTETQVAVLQNNGTRENLNTFNLFFYGVSHGKLVVVTVVESIERRAR